MPIRPPSGRRHRFPIRAGFTLLLIVAALVVPGTLWIGSGGEERAADFRFINRGSITTLDPAAMSWMQDIRLALTIWEGLYSYHPETTEPIPGTSLPAEISADRRTYAFHLQPEAKWSNGDPVTADDFVYGWRRAMEPGTAADYSCFFDLIEGAKEYRSWRLAQTQRIGRIDDSTLKRAARDEHMAEADRRFAANVAITAMDERTLRVRLVRPVAYFLDLCAFSIFLPVHRASVEKFKIVSDDGLVYYSEQWVKPGNTFHNGPFRMTDWAFKRTIRLEKNPHYWNRDSVKLDSVELVDVEDPNTVWLFYSSGQVDWISSIDTDFAPKLIASSRSLLPHATNRRGTQRRDIHAFPAFGTYYYDFNCLERMKDGRPNPFGDRRVRQAFTMAVDKQELVDRVIRLGNPVATTFVPPDSVPGYPRVTGLPHDPEGARRLLAEAGYPGGKGFPEAVILFNTGAQHADIAQAVIGMWEKQLGVRGRIEGKEVKTFREDKKATNFMICRAGWYGDYGDPTTFLELLQTGNGNNDGSYSDPTYDRMLAEAEAAPDPQERLRKLAEAETYLVNEGVPLLPLYQYVNVFGFDPDKVKNLHLTPRMMTVIHVIEVSR